MWLIDIRLQNTHHQICLNSDLLSWVGYVMEQKTEVDCCLEALLMLRLVDGLQLTGELTTATSVHEKGSSAGGKEMDIRGNCAPGYFLILCGKDKIIHTHLAKKKGPKRKRGLLAGSQYWGM